MDRSTIKVLPTGFDDPVQLIATKVLSYLEGERLPTMTLVERSHPAASVISYSFLDGGVEVEFVTDASIRNYLEMRILGFEAFRWLMYVLRLTQPRRLRGESHIPMHYELESRFKEATLRALRNY
jgi:hypothetical protein